MSDLTSSPSLTPVEGGQVPPSSGLRSMAREVLRTAAKGSFAAADLFLGDWPGPRILIYHQIGAGSGRQMDLSTEMFRGHVKWLLDHGRIVGFGDALSGADDPESNRQFVLTFDDGYADFYENGFPLLREQGIPFTLYLTSGHIETGEVLHPGDRPLSWDQVDEMLSTGLVTLGAHTHTHPDLRGLSVEADRRGDWAVESSHRSTDRADPRALCLSEGLLGRDRREGRSGQLLDSGAGGRIPGYTKHGPL